MSSTFDPAKVLLSITQDGRPIEYYVEEFLQLTHQVQWNYGTLKVGFWSGLNDLLYLQAPAATTPGSLVQNIDHVLLLAGSPFTVGDIDKDAKVTPVPKSSPPVESMANPTIESMASPPTRRVLQSPVSSFFQRSPASLPKFHCEVCVWFLQHLRVPVIDFILFQLPSSYRLLSPLI
ncbi:hypothetical protein G5714_016442 [Onychostoma macrolepis]|uniref:Uncharacterized protein n=1 Tax=Onychostoma macrolepis TaxID=369639 RepID=A0A7J6C8D9_9TELE|nr:hypothetical protein G5714_016442 [Onychostoma macrolepis]